MNDLSMNDLSLNELTLNDLSLNELRARERNLEEEWISKYRAALQSVPRRETWEERLHTLALQLYRNAALLARETKTKILTSKIVTRWMQVVSVSPSTAANAQPQFSVVRTLEAIKPHKSHDRLRDQNAKKAG
jgi:hypothetical protein